MPRSVPPKGMRIFRQRRKYCPRGAPAKNPCKIAGPTRPRLNSAWRFASRGRVLSERRFFYRRRDRAARTDLEAIERTIAYRRCIGTCPAGHGVERGGWNGPRKHGEGGNTPAERGLTRRGGTGGAAGRWRVTTAFCTRLCMCEYVYVREYRDGLWARASTYEGTESRRVSSIDEKG